EIDELRVLGEDRRIEVERVHRDRGTREALDRRAVLLVHVPQRMAYHFEGHRVDVLLTLSMQLELRRDGEFRRRHIAGAYSVEGDAGELGELFKRCVHFFSSGFLLGVNSSGWLSFSESWDFLSRPE